MSSTATRHSPMHHEPQRRPGNDLEIARKLGLCDASLLARMGLKGPSAAQWLARQGLDVPQKIYGVNEIDADGLLLRTGTFEYLIEDGPGGSTVARLWDAAEDQPGFTRAVRQDASMLLSGQNAFEVLAQTCGYNFRQPDAELVFSRVAGVSCAILRRDGAISPTFRIWCDPSFGPYLWETLLEIAREAGGDTVAMSCFYPGALK